MFSQSNDVIGIHQQMEQFNSLWLKDFEAKRQRVHCHKGCSSCCSLAVHATLPEAAIIANNLTDVHCRRLSKYVVRLRKLISDHRDLKSYLRFHRESVGHCPFLSDSSQCGIYISRPLSCRSLLSTRPEAWCAVDMATLDEWDKRLYKQNLDPDIVAWPTHYVAATQEYARTLENQICQRHKKIYGWTLSGNFPLLVWIERQHHLSLDPPINHLEKLKALVADYPTVLDLQY